MIIIIILIVWFLCQIVQSVLHIEDDIVNIKTPGVRSPFLDVLDYLPVPRTQSEVCVYS
jgi:hypothetical protein